MPPIIALLQETISSKQISSRQESATGTLFLIANPDTSMMETYTETGELIETRRLRPDERDQNIFPISKAS